MTGRIGPTGKRQFWRFAFFLFGISVAEKTSRSLGVLLLRVGVSGTAVFAEPAISQIEKVVCLIHVSIRTGSGSDRPNAQPGYQQPSDCDGDWNIQIVQSRLPLPVLIQTSAERIPRFTGES
ncbi:MAG TPA: hypothetical protein VGJ48_22020 [Pyrinomonadaceae bacterium]